MASNLVCYTGSGCNRVPHCADWGRNSLICYGSCNGVVVYCPDVSNNIPTFSVAHTKFIQRTRSGVRVIPRQLLKRVNLIHIFILFLFFYLILCSYLFLLLWCTLLVSVNLALVKGLGCVVAVVCRRLAEAARADLH